MKISKLYSSLALAALLLTGCGKEAPFTGETLEKGEGGITRSAITLDVKDESIVNTKAAEAVSIDDFHISFTKDGQTTPTISYKYAEMPEIVTLPAGVYFAEAVYGGEYESSAKCGWDVPHYYGKTENFEIKAGEITENIGTLSCALQNVKVSIVFDKNLRVAMSEDAYVEVKVSKEGSEESGLRFTAKHEDDGVCGYFEHLDGVSLAATFYGDVEGQKTVVTKTYNTVNKGYHYKLTFKLHTRDSENPGAVTGAVGVDATVDIVDLEHDYVIADEEILEDDERPREPEGDDPTPPTPAEIPTIAGEGSIDLDKVNVMDGSEPACLTVISTAKGGFTAFDVEIISDALSPEELAGVGLIPHINLAETPDELVSKLSELGFPVNVKGMNRADISIQAYLISLLGQVSHEGDIHEFKLTVKDANGTSVKSLKICVTK